MKQMLTVNDIPALQAYDMMMDARRHPIQFMQTMMGADFWSFQKEIVESVAQNRYTSVKACHAPGKTHCAGRLALWFLNAYAPSKVITTAPSARQVYSLLWSEIREAHAKSRKLLPPGLGGVCLKTRLELDPGWFAEGFSTQEYDPERFQGYHAPYILIIVDEASGVPDTIFNSVDGLMSSGDAHCLYISNPTRGDGKFRESFKSDMFNKISMSAFQTPNFTTFGITRKDIQTGEWHRKIGNCPLPRPYLVNPGWVAERAKNWGMDSLLFRVKVDGEFPEEDQTDKVIPLYLMTIAKETEFPEDVKVAAVELGVDVARYGSDESVIAIRAGRAAIKERYLSQRSTMALTGAIMEECEHIGWQRVTKIKIDVIGLGAAPVDRLLELQDEGVVPSHVYIMGVNVAMAARQARFMAQRDELIYNFRELLQSGEIDARVFSEETIREFVEPTYEVTSKGKIKVEGKDELRQARRLGRSPDRMDAWVLAFGDCISDRKVKAKLRIRSSIREV